MMSVAELEIRPNVFYTPEEAAALLRVPPQGVTELLESGRARAVRIGEAWRVLGHDLLNLPRTDDAPSDIELTRALTKLSEPALARVWDNDEDAVYDTL